MNAARLGWNAYGKSRVRLLKVRRPAPGQSGRHDVVELTVSIALEGDFAAAHLEGDNRAVLPTDTMKNTVYVLAKAHPIDTIEAFALHLARHFLSKDASLRSARVSISERAWQRVKGADGGPHPHAFIGCSEEQRTCEAIVRADAAGATVDSGIDGLVLMKTTDSAFSGFRRDPLTTLRDTDDRVLCTSATVRWRHRDATPPAGSAGFADSRRAIREALIATFAAHPSRSVQHTLFAMGRAALDAADAVDSIRLSLPNRHYHLADLSPFGLGNENEIFIPTDEPHGLIEAVVERA